MRKEYLLSLEAEAKAVAKKFSSRTPEISLYSENGLTFTVDVIAPSSDMTATVTYKKSDGIRALAFFYCVKYKSGIVWRYFFPTDSHICGMSDFARRKAIIEEANYSLRKAYE